MRTTDARRGVSLTELLLLMSACTMILSMCTVLLYRVMRVEIDSRSFVDAERTSARLSRQTRQDIHQATAVEVDGANTANGVFLRIQLPDNENIAYGRVNGNILRTESHGDKVAGRDEFAFEPSCKLEASEDKAAKRIVLLMTSPPLDEASNKAEQLRSYQSVPVGLHVEASIGRDVASANPITVEERAK
jgi:hypothetical protein